MTRTFQHHFASGHTCTVRLSLDRASVRCEARWTPHLPTFTDELEQEYELWRNAAVDSFIDALPLEDKIEIASAAMRRVARED